MTELWKDISNCSGYQISSLGRVRGPRGIRKLTFRKDRRVQVIIHKRTYAIHRLVAEAFIPNPNNYTEVHHKDKNPMNNRVDNLLWCSFEQHWEFHRAKNGKGKYIRSAESKRRHKETNKILYQKKRQERLEYSRKYYQENKEKKKEQVRARRERLKQQSR